MPDQQNLSALPLRDVLLDRWLDPENDDPAEWTDEMLTKRIEDLVGEGWYHAGREAEQASKLRAALTRIALYPFDVNEDAVNDLFRVKEIAQEALDA